MHDTVAMDVRDALEQLVHERLHGELGQRVGRATTGAVHELFEVGVQVLKHLCIARSSEEQAKHQACLVEVSTVSHVGTPPARRHAAAVFSQPAVALQVRRHAATGECEAASGRGGFRRFDSGSAARVPWRGSHSQWMGAGWES